MNLFSKVTTDIIDIAKYLAKTREWIIDNYDSVSVEMPKDPSHGDMATNIAMIIANKINLSPRAVAEIIVSQLSDLDYITKIEIAGPGFINLVLDHSIWQQQLKSIITLGSDYGNSDIGKGIKVNLEYVSTNPTGPMHIGHARGAVYGDALAAVLSKCRYEVTKEYYVNDAGKQIDILAESVYVRYANLYGKEMELPDYCYPGEYIIDAAKTLQTQYSSDLLSYERSQWLPLIRKFAVDAMLVLIRSDLADLGVEHEVFTHESTLHAQNKIQCAVDLLEAKNLVYRGILEPPKGKILEDWEEREQLLFKSTSFGDDVDRALQKSDGSWTYFGAELAYFKDKIDRGFEELIMVLGADHGGYVKRSKAASRALSDNKCDVDIKLVQMVNFLKDGQPLKMSKRAGNFITVQDIIELVGKDVIRFIMLTRKNDMVLDFDVEKVIDQSKDNPVFYVQYAHARAHSILRNAFQIIPKAVEMLEDIKALDLSVLTSATEVNLIKLLSYWPKQIELAARNREPHRIAFFVQSVAAEFHAFWNRGKESNSLRFIVENDVDLTAARLTLVSAVSKIIASALEIIGVQAMNEM
jgi:arginyl-tRNA synthetase